MGKIGVFLAEDHTIVREGLKELINKENDYIVVGEAENGGDAVNYCRDLEPDIVIMDLAMPALNGIEATRIIKKENPDTKIIILSMYSDDEYALKVIEAGASGYLVKKSAAADLINAIQVVNDGKAFFSPEISKKVLDAYNAMVKKYGSIEKDRKKQQSLTLREREILQLIAEGCTSKKIAEKLFISVYTVQRHREKIRQKIGARDIAGLTRYAIEKKIIASDESKL